MASATEQLTRQFNWGSFAKAKDLKARLLFTLGALIIYRLGTHVPLPGVNPAAISAFFSDKSANLLGIFNMFSGGSLQRMAIFAIGITPYITASIIIQVMSWGDTIPFLSDLKKEGEQGRRKLNQYTRYLTIAIGLGQSYLLARWLEGLGQAVNMPGIFFEISTIVSLLAGTFFLMWLGEQITARGIGNGISLFIFCGIVANIPAAVARTLALGREGAISTVVIIGLMLLIVAVFFLAVYVERAQRRVVVQYPKRQTQPGQRVFGTESSYVPLKLNPSGIYPAMFASALISVPMTIIAFSSRNTGGGRLAEYAAYLQSGSPLHMILYGTLLMFFVYFCTGLVFNPPETAENLRKAGGFVPGVKPGRNTADYLHYVVMRIATLGGLFIVFICLMPELLTSQLSLPFYFGGTALLLVVSVPLDTIAQIHSHLIAHQYEGLLTKRRVKGVRRK